MTVLMGTMAVTGLYGMLRLLWRAFGPVPAFAVAALVLGGLHLANPGATLLGGATVTAAG